MVRFNPEKIDKFRMVFFITFVLYPQLVRILNPCYRIFIIYLYSFEVERPSKSQATHFAEL